MLSLSRKEGQETTILIKDVAVKVVVSHIGKSKAILSFDAPKEVEIVRQELIEKG